MGEDVTDFFTAIEWSPTIGDPSFMGWFTVLAYFFAFCISLKIYLNGNKLFYRVRSKQKFLWFVICCLMIFLCINKQLDLQTFFTATARYLFLEYGVYKYRRYFQEFFIIMILFSGIFVSVMLFLQYRKVIKNHLLAIIGLVFLMVFILARASSFHHMDMLIGIDFFGIKMNWVLELTGIGMIIANGIKLLKRKRVRIPAPEKSEIG